MSNMDEQEKRIAALLGEEEVPEVNVETLKKYLSYLEASVDRSCELTGIEDFKWEEYYLIGPGSAREHKKLRKTRPSYLDNYKIIRFENDIEIDYGLFVKVRRVSDKKQFVLPLSDLKVMDKKHPTYQLLHDYSVWFVNWR